MWKSLNSGEKVHPGDTIRYWPSLSYLKASINKIYDVIKTDLHYFEMEARLDMADGFEADRKVIKYMDIGYHIRLEVWSGENPLLQPE